MELVIDANIIISALISPTGKTSEIIFSDKLKLYAPKYLQEEISKHMREISKKSGLSDEEIEILLSLMFLNIEIISFPNFKKFMKQASEICPDPNDEEYFALSLKLKCPLWSNDAKLKHGQNLLKVLNTGEVVSIFFKS